MIKNEKDIERQKMREDIMKKKREKMREGGGEVKVEIVGMEFMHQAAATEEPDQAYKRPSSNLKEMKQKYKVEKS